MSHTLHRRGNADGMKNDFVLFAMSAKGINEADSAVKLKEFLQIVSRFNPVNMGDMKTGNEFITPAENIIGSTQDTSIVHGVFATRKDLICALKAIKEADLGISVIVSGILDDVEECCRESGIKRHTCETSLGIWGRQDRLPEEDILQFTTMCGHGMVAFSLVRKIIEDIQCGRRTIEEGARELAKPCQCGVFNPVRAAALLEEIICLWGIRVA